MAENSLIKKEKLNIFQKIKAFFKKIFYNELEAEHINIINNKKIYNSLDEIKKENKLIRLQEQYENGNIIEEDLSENEKEDLLKLYRKQITTLKENVFSYKKILEEYKTKIINIRRRENI